MTPPKLADGSGVAAYEVGLKVRELPREVRPRERLLQRGAADLSDAELLAIILRTGSQRAGAHVLASQVLARYGGLAGVDRASITELCQSHGLGTVKSIELKAAVELGKRLVSLHPSQRARIGSPRDIFNLMRGEMSALEQEELRVLLLTTKNDVLSSHMLYRGSINSTGVRLGELFKEAIRQNAAGVVLVHNHPSGDPTPSPEDVRVTRDAVEAGRLLEVDVVDHVIVGQGDTGYVSLRERGLGFRAEAGR